MAQTRWCRSRVAAHQIPKWYEKAPIHTHTHLRGENRCWVQCSDGSCGCKWAAWNKQKTNNKKKYSNRATTLPATCCCHKWAISNARAAAKWRYWCTTRWPWLFRWLARAARNCWKTVNEIWNKNNNKSKGSKI